MQAVVLIKDDSFSFIVYENLQKFSLFTTETTFISLMALYRSQIEAGPMNSVENNTTFQI